MQLLNNVPFLVGYSVLALFYLGMQIQEDRKNSNSSIAMFITTILFPIFMSISLGKLFQHKMEK